MFEGIQRSLCEALKKLRGRGRITEANIREGCRRSARPCSTPTSTSPSPTTSSQRVTEQSRRPGGPRARSTPASRSSRSSTTSWSSSMGPVDHELPLRQGSADRHHAVRPAGQRQNDHRRQAGPDPARSAAASRCWSPPTCSAPPPSSSSRCSANRSTCRSTARRRPPRRSTSAATPSPTPRTTLLDTVILDTAGRLHIAEMPMDELKQIDRLVQARRGLPRLRRHDRPGRRQQRQGVQRRPRPQRRHPDQAGRRRPRRRGPVDQGSHQGPDQVHRRRREARPAGGVSSRGHGPAHPRPGRHHGPDREGQPGPAGASARRRSRSSRRSWPRATSPSTTSASSSSR